MNQNNFTNSPISISFNISGDFLIFLSILVLSFFLIREIWNWLVKNPKKFGQISKILNSKNNSK